MCAKYLILLSLLVWIAEAQQKTKVFNVKNYGAIADEKTDNSAVLLKAWNEACKWNGKATVLIPKGSYMLRTVLFKGPCKGRINFVINGVLKAPTNLSFLTSENWINFRYVNQLIVNGGGILDGQGASAWACRKDPQCHQNPFHTTMRLDFITNGYVENLQSINSKTGHFVIFGSENITFTNVQISAPRDSPNTDGIKIGSSIGVNITSVTIGTGDDCIAMISGTKRVRISDAFCGPGHGISVGSMGKTYGEKDVQDVIVKNCTFNATSDGLRIKTWASPLNKILHASDFLYEDIVINKVDHPINIDQEYCPQPPCVPKVPSNVQISNVIYKNIRGSANGDIAVNLKCSQRRPCKNITLENINLWRYGKKGTLRNSCYNVKVISKGKQIPSSCK